MEIWVSEENIGGSKVMLTSFLLVYSVVSRLLQFPQAGKALLQGICGVVRAQRS